ncbi:MAG: hypothetical protein AVO35_04490 [Candidatus Aegiribacteria sp. MLS_C]|nr:MAG: hypothetical protein AVO35_04490 [Candidatus Aegiribacteria sp. MLS_C]
MDGVRLLELVRVPDSRGSFLELFRMKWLEDLFTDQVQVNCSISRAGVLRGMHYHERQWDLWVPVRGNMNVGLADLRRDSATHGTAVTLRMGGDDPRGLLIPPGVAHGYAALSDIILIYVVNRYYDGTDEFGTAWDDPALGIEWGLKDPLLSERDRDNPGTGW